MVPRAFAHHRLTLRALHCHCPFLDQLIPLQSNGDDTMTLPPGRFDYAAINDRPIIRWPNNARVAFWVAPNMEFFE